MLLKRRQRYAEKKSMAHSTKTKSDSNTPEVMLLLEVKETNQSTGHTTKINTSSIHCINTRESVNVRKTHNTAAMSVWSEPRGSNTLKKKISFLTSNSIKLDMANTVKSSTTPKDMDKFYDKHSKYVWVVRFEDVNSEIRFQYRTAFSYSREYLVSIADAYFLSQTCEVWARRSHEKDFIHELEVASSDPSLDITLLKIKNGPVSGRHGRLAKYGSLKGNENIYGISNVDGYNGTFYDGRLAYPVPEFDYIPNLFDSSTCENYKFNSFEDPLPLYRKIGHIFNEGNLNNNKNETIFRKDLNPHIPLLECLEFRRPGGGGPVLNHKGEIVGMLISGRYPITLAIHVSVLRTFIKNYFKKKLKESRKRRKDRMKEERENKKTKV